MRERWLSFWSRLDPGFLVVALIAFIAIWPFVSRASLPVETDAELHIFRLHELGQLIRGGEIYPRWAPDFYHGYGYPIFNYYAPLTYYVGLLVELWPPFDAVVGVKAVFVLGMLLGAVGMYGFVRDNWGRTAGYVATAVYLYAPYVQYIDPHARGVLPESFSLGLFPLVLWALDRLRRGGGTKTWLAAVWLSTAVILSHNLMALLFTGIFFAWAVWHVGLRYLSSRRNGAAGTDQIGWVLLALLLGVGTAAFFWLPVYLEREAVNLGTLLGVGDNYDFRTHFLSLREMLAFSSRLDWGASEPAFRFNLGVAQWLLGGLGLVLLLLGKVKRAGQTAFFAVALTVLIFLMLPASQFVWEALPFLPFFQFPWRLLGPAAAMLAVLAGAGTAVFMETQSVWLTRQRRAALAALFIVFPMLLGLPLSQPAPWPDFGEVNTLRMSLIENSGRWLGTTSTADYVPATVDTIPQRKGSVISGIAEGLPIDRINYATLPDGATVTPEYVRPLLTRYHVDTPKAMRLRLFQFDFPGWQARINGDLVETELGRPEGFLVIPVPAGSHVVEVKFGSTPARTTAVGITAISLLLSLGLGWQLRRHQRPKTAPMRAFGLTDKVVVGAVLVLTAVFILVLEPAGWLHDSSTGFTAVPAQTDLFADFGEQIALIGFTAPTRTVQPGDSLTVTLYWKSQQPELNINYQAFLHVLKPDGGLLVQSHKLNPGDFPTRRWSSTEYVRDVHVVQMPSEVLPGTYTVAAGLWVQTEGWRLPVLNAAGEQIGDNLPLFTLEVQE